MLASSVDKLPPCGVPACESRSQVSVLKIPVLAAPCRRHHPRSCWPSALLERAQNPAWRCRRSCWGALGELAADALRGQRPSADSPLAGMVSEQRRFATITASVRDLKGSPLGAPAHDQRCGTDYDLWRATDLATDSGAIRSGSSLTALV
jgi:hypothetical protein